jgi:3'-phosphoadenosine 5'-phosphosulfate sulfotransferase (PAPS reductase)/FAD synthetase
VSDPFLLDRPAVISFSGGRTSGLMLRRILDAFGGKLPADVVPIFTNTGKERPETLDFIERVSLEWEVPVVWLEFRRWLSDPGPAEGRWTCKPRDAARPLTGLEVVNYATASRDGRPFLELITGKAMLPNQAMRYCTQKMKIQTSWRYVRNVLGWKQYTNAIGLRHDEPKRSVKPEPKTTPGEEPVTPLKAARVRIADVKAFWASQPFDLQLLPHEGNCDLCMLKGQGKLLEIMSRHPELAAWWIEQEQRFIGKTKKFEAGRFRKNAPSYRATLEAAQQPTLFPLTYDLDSVDCRCTD